MTSPINHVSKCSHESCKKRLALTDVQCRCGKIFCGIHRVNHACTFDYKGMQREKLEKENLAVIPSKIKKI